MSYIVTSHFIVMNINLTSLEF